MFSSLFFHHPFRKYQRMILAQVEAGEGDHKYHIVAPPGAGKTIVGLELIRRFGYPAVVFSPTSTIQRQWQEKLGLFTSSPAEGESLTSLDPARLAPVNLFTYQLISTAGEAQEWVRQMALQRWTEDLIFDGQVSDEAAALARQETLRQNNPNAYQKEIARRYLKVKHNLLREPGGKVEEFLHPNARALIRSLVDYGVRTIVLDECHHLLDYWAIVIRHLIGQIKDPRVIGLTATLPSPEDDQEYENYTSLLGEVDFEVPTPAVVKEGDLAPYRDLVFFVRPSRRETAYLSQIQKSFEAAIAELTDSAAFRGWVVKTILERGGADGEAVPWEAFLSRSPVLALAGLRFLVHSAFPLPADLPLPLEAQDKLELEDWAVLLERFGLDYLALSPEAGDHRQLARLRKILQPFGFTLTERGLRHSRSPGDLVLSFSESKDAAVAHILRLESQALGERLRAVVVTDFERMSSGVKSMAGVLDRDAGSALRLIGRLAAHPELQALCPVLVTGSLVLAAAARAPQLLAAFNAYLAGQQARTGCSLRPTASPHLVEIVGDGPEWSSRLYMAMVTAAFDQGLTRCLVGTRGIFGEGWDSLTLNTLIDLTSVTTSTSVQQLRGRSIRKDPAWPHKVAHNWDVVCVAPKFEKGYPDLARFLKRHERYWGIVPLSATEQAWQDSDLVLGTMLGKLVGDQGAAFGSPQLGGSGAAPGPDMHGRIIKGVGHVSPELAYDLALRGFRLTNYGRYTAQSMAQIRRREESYKLWGIGEEYSNFSYPATRLDSRDLRIRTVFTLQATIKALLRSFRASILAGISTSFWIGLQIAMQSGAGFSDFGIGLITQILVLGTVVTFLFNLRQAYRLYHKLFVEQPPDGILLDVGRALLMALKETGLVSRSLQMEYVRVIEQPDNSYEVLLDYASPEDATTFITAFRQVFAPVVDQRYLILRDDSRLPSPLLTPVWAALRRRLRGVAGYEPASHPVPDLLAARKERAEMYARYWKRYVGGSQLIYTRNETGRRILLQARAQRRPKVKSLAFEVWR